MPCRLCGGEAPPFSARGLAYGDCPGCGTISLEAAALPSPAAEEARYRLHRNDPAEPGYRAFLEAFIERAFLPRAWPGAALLDFGSGPGAPLAALLRERGFRVDCHDPFFAPGEAWRDRTWDFILLHEVAEHFFEPGERFRELAGLLAPGGRLAIRTRFCPSSQEDFARWWYREDPTHVSFFRPRSFSWMAEAFGLALELLEEPDIVLLRRP
jgi:SAM-dependent methyltransferase